MLYFLNLLTVLNRVQDNHWRNQEIIYNFQSEKLID